MAPANNRTASLTTERQPASHHQEPGSAPKTTNPATLPAAPPSLGQRLLRGAVLLGVMGVSTALGVVATLSLPLPTGLLPNDQGAKPLKDIIEYGFQYRVARPVNILIMGIDRVPEASEGSPEIFQGRSDTILLLRVDPTDDSVSLLSIPRDTQVELPRFGITKINDANVEGGAPLAAQTVSSILNGVPIDRYVRVSTGAFRELVDLMGGIEIYVPKPMSYRDQTQKLNIDLAQGWQTLDGAQAEQFARFRDEDGDIGRVQRQQMLLQALKKRLTNPLVLTRLPKIIGEMQKYIDTNLSLEEMLALLSAGRRISQGDVRMVMLPGRFSQPDEFVASYWLMDTTGRDRIMQQFFGIAPVNNDLAATERPLSDLAIAVQNATGAPYAGSDFSRYLGSLGLSRIFLGADWVERLETTQIIVQRGDLAAARELRDRLGFGEIQANSTGTLDSDLTIRVGADWLQQSRR